MPFLTIYTPTYKRPGLLARNIASVEAQSVDDWQHVIVHDLVGLGIDGMFGDVVNHLDEINGEYVYFLQDDDRLADENVVRDVRTAALVLNKPPLLMVKNKKRGNVYPTYWRERPQIGHVDLGSFVVRADVFRANADKFGRRYAGDYDFIDALWAQYAVEARWYDRLVAEAMTLGLGRSEAHLRQQRELI